MDETLLNDLQRTHFNFFWKLTNTANGLVPDRASATNNEAMSSIAATGFGLTAYIVGVERGFVTRDEAAQRTVVTLRTFNDAPKGTDPVFSAGYKGFFYHFLNRNTSLRKDKNDLGRPPPAGGGPGSGPPHTMTRTKPEKNEIRRLADELYRAVDWKWAMNEGELMSLGWTPESGFQPYTWQGYNEAMILYILAIGSPETDKKLDGSVWNRWTATYNYSSFQNYEMVNFSPLFGHQYSHMWIDFAGDQGRLHALQTGSRLFRKFPASHAGQP